MFFVLGVLGFWVGSPVVGLGAVAAWVLLFLPAARGIVRADGARYLRALPIPRWPRAAIGAAALVGLQLPWLLVWLVGAGALGAAIAALVTGLVAGLALIRGRPPRVGELRWRGPRVALFGVYARGLRRRAADTLIRGVGLAGLAGLAGGLFARHNDLGPREASVLAAAVTFPLSFGWIRFETPRDSQASYDAYLFGLRVFRFPLDSLVAPLVFDILDISAVLVLIGVGLAMWRRMRDRGALALQQFANDLLPLWLLFAISVSGIVLTVSTHWLRGFHYDFLAQLHAVTVIFTLVYLPFGKFFHIFQRPAQLSLDFYRRAGAATGAQPCARCGAGFASKLHVGDLKRVEAELGIRFAMQGDVHYQDVCPPCRRKSLALTQDGLWRHRREGI